MMATFLVLLPFVARPMRAGRAANDDRNRPDDPLSPFRNHTTTLSPPWKQQQR
jgi:hypothetical protein